MLNQGKLLKAIEDDLRVCREARQRLHPADSPGIQQNTLESNILMEHLQWARRADQAELERVVRSLETNLVVRSYQRWRERSEAA